MPTLHRQQTIHPKIVDILSFCCILLEIDIQHKVQPTCNVEEKEYMIIFTYIYALYLHCISQKKNVFSTISASKIFFSENSDQEDFLILQFEPLHVDRQELSF